MKQQNIFLLPKTIVGQVVGDKERVEINCITEGELEALLREIGKFDYQFNRGRDIVSVEFNLAGAKLFIDMSQSEYKQLCDFYFKNKIADSQADSQNEI